MFPRISFVLLLFLLGFTMSCARMPRDGRSTTQRVIDSHRLRVGLIENPPWVIRGEDEPAGAEVDMIKDFAASLGAEPEWHWADDEDLLADLQKFNIDIVAGGIGDNTPWRDKVGLTSPFYTEKFDIGIPEGTPVPWSLDGVEVSVGEDDKLADYVRSRHAIPLAVWDRTKAAAGPQWKLQKLGLTATGNDLLSISHVIAVPPGEGQFLMRLDDYLYDRIGEISVLLQRQPDTQTMIGRNRGTRALE